jgi:hypothetical protein
MDQMAARQMLLTHFLGERDQDLDATMAPLSTNATWLFPNYRLEGRRAVQAFYAKTLAGLPDGRMDECIRALDDPQITRWGATHCVIEYSDGYPMHHGWVMVVHFDEDGIRSENVYPRSDSGIHPDLGEDFDALPGVTRLPENGLTSDMGILTRTRT